MGDEYIRVDIKYDMLCEMDAGSLLRAKRREHGCTQKQLAVRARTSQAAISRIERNVVSPSVSTLARLLDLLGERLELSASAIDYGHDREALRANLKLTPEQRIHRQVAHANRLRSGY
jgi:transcriptional regulator with XRE-family HTH domain